MTETQGPSRAGRVRESVLVALLLTALAIVLTWPAAAFLGSTVTDLGDPVLTTYILAWNVHALGATPLRLFDANMFHPHRGTLAYTDHHLGLVPLVWPVRLLGAGAVFAHNVVWLATFPLTGLTLFWLVRHLTGHAGAATVAAVLYAFSHFRFGQLGHIQILSHQWLPLMLLGLHRAAESGGRWRDVALAAGAFAVQALCTGYYAFFAAIAGALFVVWLAGPSTRPPLGRLAARGVLAAALVALLLLPFFLPYRFVRDEIGLPGASREITHFSARPASYLAAPVVNRWLGEATARFRGEEAVLFPGLVALALAVPGFVLAWRGRGTASGGTPAEGRRWPAGLDVALAVVLLVTVANWILLGGVFAPDRGVPAVAATLRRAVPRARPGLRRAPFRPAPPRARPRAGLAPPDRVAQQLGVLRRAHARRRDRLVRALAGARARAPPPPRLSPALGVRPRLRRAPGPGALRRAGHDGARDPRRVRRGRPRATASPSWVARGRAGRARRPRGPGSLGRAAPAHDRAARSGADRPVARRPARRLGGGPRPADVRAPRRAPGEPPAARLHGALAPPGQRLCRRVPGRPSRGPSPC